MYKRLKRPQLWAKSPAPLWSDAHISKGMLAAHINPDFDGASRRGEFIARSAQWIAECCAPTTGKRLLDLGCGPGLYAERLAQSGFTVFGMDLSPRSIGYAKEHTSAEISYTCADYLQAPLPENLDVITLIYCDFGVLPPKARERLLGRIFHALKPGGRLIFDVFTHRQYQNFKEHSAITEHDGSGFWAAEPHIVLERKLAYPEDRTFLHQVGVATEDAFKTYHIWEHVFTRQELRQELKNAGFGTMEFYGDACGIKFSPKSRTLCVVAGKEERFS